MTKANRTNNLTKSGLQIALLLWTCTVQAAIDFKFVSKQKIAQMQAVENGCHGFFSSTQDATDFHRSISDFAGDATLLGNFQLELNTLATACQNPQVNAHNGTFLQDLYTSFARSKNSLNGIVINPKNQTIIKAFRDKIRTSIVNRISEQLLSINAQLPGAPSQYQNHFIPMARAILAEINKDALWDSQDLTASIQHIEQFTSRLHAAVVQNNYDQLNQAVGGGAPNHQIETALNALIALAGPAPAPDFSNTGHAAFLGLLQAGANHGETMTADLITKSLDELKAKIPAAPPHVLAAMAVPAAATPDAQKKAWVDAVQSFKENMTLMPQLQAVANAAFAGASSNVAEFSKLGISAAILASQAAGITAAEKQFLQEELLGRSLLNSWRKLNERSPAINLLANPVPAPAINLAQLLTQNITAGIIHAAPTPADTDQAYTEFAQFLDKAISMKSSTESANAYLELAIRSVHGVGFPQADLVDFSKVILKEKMLKLGIQATDADALLAHVGLPITNANIASINGANGLIAFEQLLDKALSGNGSAYLKVAQYFASTVGVPAFGFVPVGTAEVTVAKQSLEKRGRDLLEDKKKQVVKNISDATLSDQIDRFLIIDAQILPAGAPNLLPQYELTEDAMNSLLEVAKKGNLERLSQFTSFQAAVTALDPTNNFKNLLQLVDLKSITSAAALAADADPAAAGGGSPDIDGGACPVPVRVGSEEEIRKDLSELFKFINKRESLADSTSGKEKADKIESLKKAKITFAGGAKKPMTCSLDGQDIDLKPFQVWGRGKKLVDSQVSKVISGLSNNKKISRRHFQIVVLDGGEWGILDLSRHGIDGLTKEFKGKDHVYSIKDNGGKFELPGGHEIKCQEKGP